MYLIQIHSSFAYIVLALVFIFIISIFFSYLGKKRPSTVTKKLGLFAIIFTHIQVLIGIVQYFIFSPKGISMVSNEAFSMSNASMRLLVVEHPIAMLVGATLLTITYSKIKRMKSNTTLGIFLLGLAAAALLFSRIPYAVWL